MFRFQRSVILLSIGFFLLAGVAIAVALFTISAQSTVAMQANFFRASIRITNLLSALQDAETSQRGYLITHDATYLKPYNDALAVLPTSMSALEDVLTNRPDLQESFARLKDLVPKKLEELKRTIELADTGMVDAAIAIVRADAGRALMEEIRRVVAEMRQRQANGLTTLNAETAEAATRLRWGVGAVVLLVLVLGGLAFMDKRRQRLELQRHSLEVEGHSRALEETNRLLNAEMRSRQAAEAQVRQMQKIEAVGQLTGGIAHDFNNMLAVITSALGIAQRRIASADYQIEKYINSAIEACNRAATLTKRLLAFSRQQPLAPEPLDANKVVADMSELLRRTIGETVAFETVLAGGLWRTNVDLGQLENSIINLAVNSRDAMPEGGRITVETANAHLDERYTRENPGAEAGQYVMIAVTDTGSGMPPEVAERAFDPFFTTKGVGRGTGLGLSQVYGFVKQSGGHIKIYSEVGQGTTVKLYLPRFFAADGAVPRPTDKPVPVQAEAAGQLILVVEDEERVRTLSVDSLRELGYRVLEADGGKAALDMLHQHPDVELLFTDIVMPDMNGRKLAEAALAFRPGLRVLYTTGFTRNAVVHNGILDPGVKFLAKPFNLEQLAAKVHDALHS